VSADVMVIRVVIGGESREVVVDPRAMTLMERRLIKVELAKLGYEPDDTDVLAGSIWIAMRRDDPALTYDEVCEAITFEDLRDPDEVATADQDPQDPN
jgi:hypothetical protein